MSHRNWMLAAAMAVLTPIAVVAQDTSPEFKTQKDKFSYALGMNVGENLRQQGLDVDPAVFFKAFAQVLNNGKTAMGEKEMGAVLMAAAQEIRKQQAIKAAQAQAEGEKFLAENKTKQGVVTLPSGLQYKILKQGTGEKPMLEDTVVCNYRGTLINGTEFDSSDKQGGPASVQVKAVIAGWTEALQLMPVGSRWRLFVPSKLAYGLQGPPDIGPNATLIFEVELVSLQKAPRVPAAEKQTGSK